MSDSTPRPVPQAPPPVAHLELKAGLLLLAMLLLVIASAVYLLYARGTFERTQQLTLGPLSGNASHFGRNRVTIRLIRVP